MLTRIDTDLVRRDHPIGDVVAHYGIELRRVGRALVDRGLERFRSIGVDRAKVVTTADNAAALALYRACGFGGERSVSVHEGTASEVLVWSSS